MRPDAYTLVVSSHKGGTGRTTLACALAWHLGQQGRAVLLADADPVGAVRLIAGDAPRWKNVRTLPRLPRPGDVRGIDVVVVDGPALLGAGAAEVLAAADGLVLTCLADPLSLRTVPAAARAVAAAQEGNPRLELLGVVANAFDPLDPLQRSLLDRLRQSQPGLLLDPPVPLDAAVREWPAAPGTPPPAGPAAGAFAALARALDAVVGSGAAV